MANQLILTGTINPSTSTGHLYGYTVLIGCGCGSFFTAGFAVLQALLPASELSNGIAFMSIGEHVLCFDLYINIYIRIRKLFS